VVEPPSFESDCEMQEWKENAPASESITHTHVHHHSCKSRRTKDDTPSQMSRLLAPNSNPSIVSLISPFTRKSLKTIKDALSAAYATKYPIKLTEIYAAVLVPLCNLTGNPGLPLEVREKTGAHSG